MTMNASCVTSSTLGAKPHRASVVLTSFMWWEWHHAEAQRERRRIESSAAASAAPSNAHDEQLFADPTPAVDPSFEKTPRNLHTVVTMFSSGTSIQKHGIAVQIIEMMLKTHG